MTSIDRKNSFKKDLKLIILAGGKGTRLSEETYLKPKSMDVIREKELLEKLWLEDNAPWKIW